MKNLKYLVVLLLFAVASCISDIPGKLDDLSGTWKLTEMSYTDSSGVSETISDSQTTLLFTKDIATGNTAVDGVRYGVQDVGEEAFDFEYSIDFSQGYIDLLMNQSDKEKLPIDAIGRVQVYQFRQTDKNHLEFFVETEADYAKGEFETLTNVRYVFERE